jgi:hypothetical protein
VVRGLREARSFVRNFNPRILGAAHRRLGGQSVKRLKWNVPDAVVSEKAAREEANNLVNPQKPDLFMTVDDLAGKTVRQIADLDIAPNHPLWHTESFRARHPDLYAEQEAWLNGEVSKDLQKQGHNVRYSFQKASQVVFFDRIRDAATSPKIGCTDVFGNKIGLKWGEETATEPVLSRLFLRY